MPNGTRVHNHDEARVPMGRAPPEPLVHGPQRESFLHRDARRAVELPGQHMVELHLAHHVIEQR
eukprot:4007450-Lingulodinium_polyedra.AAC.1